MAVMEIEKSDYQDLVKAKSTLEAENSNLKTDLEKSKTEASNKATGLQSHKEKSKEKLDSMQIEKDKLEAELGKFKQQLGENKIEDVMKGFTGFQEAETKRIEALNTTIEGYKEKLGPEYIEKRQAMIDSMTPDAQNDYLRDVCEAGGMLEADKPDAGSIATPPTGKDIPSNKSATKFDTALSSGANSNDLGSILAGNL